MSTAVAFLITVLCVLVYFTPSIIAAVRHVHNFGTIIIVNVFLGWTIVGWIIALAMSFSTTKVHYN